MNEFLSGKEYKKLIEEQGRRIGWIAKQLDCSYSLIYQYLNELKPMSKKKIEVLHKILVG